MTNLECYKTELEKLAIEPGNEMCEWICKHLLDSYNLTCDSIPCCNCDVLRTLWFNKEYEEDINTETSSTQSSTDNPVLITTLAWETVPVDTSILVSDELLRKTTKNWIVRYFAGYYYNHPYVWVNGTTSHTVDSPLSPTSRSTWDVAGVVRRDRINYINQLNIQPGTSILVKNPTTKLYEIRKFAYWLHMADNNILDIDGQFWEEGYLFDCNIEDVKEIV